MLLIPCPFCGPRDQIEFHAGGEGDRPRPVDAMALTDAEWADFLFMRRNVRGRQMERWYHVGGCRAWFTIERDTSTHLIGYDHSARGRA